MNALTCHLAARGKGNGWNPVDARTTLLTRVADGLFYTSAACSLCCSLATLGIIARIKKKTGYLAVVASLTVSQAIYDSSFFMYQLSSFPGGSEGQRFVSFFGGLASTLWTNVLSLLLVVIIFKNTHVNVKQRYWRMGLAVFVPAASLAAAAVATSSLQELCPYNAVFWTAFSVRLVSIAFNVVCYLLLVYRLGPSSSSSSSSSNSGGGRRKSSAGFAVRVLASRLKYYALVQIVTRSTEASYELLFSLHGVSQPDDSWSRGRWAAYIAEAILCPAAGVGFLYIFLRMQPAAWESAREILQTARRYACCCCGLGQSAGKGGEEGPSSPQPSFSPPSALGVSFSLSSAPPSASPSFSFPSFLSFRASLSTQALDPHALRLLQEEAAQDEATMRQLRGLDDDELMAAIACETEADPIPSPQDAL